MNFRTDLATELRESLSDIPQGVIDHVEHFENYTIKRIEIQSDEAEKLIGRKRGRYITFELRPLDRFSDSDDVIVQAVKKEIQSLLPVNGTILVVGLGNDKVTPDALGPKAADGVLATRHIIEELKHCAGLDSLRETSVLIPGVVGQTGVETCEVIASVVQAIKPGAVVVIDALAAKSIDRLATTVQICDTGIAPGAGVGNNRSEISEETLGVPVIAIGVPTVVDARTLLYDLTGSANSNKQLTHSVVTSSQIDLLIDRASRILSQSINCAIHDKVDSEILLSLV